MRLDENDVLEEEKKQDVVKQLPGSTKEFDRWDVLIREFLQGNSLDLRSKQLNDISPKLYNYRQIQVLDLSDNTGL